MGATNKTTNYELPIFVGTDKPAWLVDWNGAMSDIDTAIKEAKTAGENAQTTANTATSDISTLSSSVSTLSGTVASQGTAISGNTGAINTINSLIGNGEPTTQDKTIIGAINEIAAEIPSGTMAADHVTYDGTTSGLTADDVQEAIDEVVAMIPVVPASTTEVQTGTLTAGATSVVLTFSEQTIGSSTLIDIYSADYDIAPTAVATTSTTVTLTFESQAADLAVAVKVQN